MVTCQIQDPVAVVRLIPRAVRLPAVRRPAAVLIRQVEVGADILRGHPKVQDREWSHQAADLVVVEIGRLTGRRERKPSIRCGQINKK